MLILYRVLSFGAVQLYQLCPFYLDICAFLHVERDSSAAGREGQIWGPESCQRVSRQPSCRKTQASLGPDSRPNSL